MMWSERELDRLALWIQLPYLFLGVWALAGAKMALELGEKTWTTE